MEEVLDLCQSKMNEYGIPLVMETLNGIGEIVPLSGVSSIDDVEVLKDEMMTIKKKVNVTIRDLKRHKTKERTQDQELKSLNERFNAQSQQLHVQSQLVHDLNEQRNEELASTLSADVVYALQSFHSVSRLEDIAELDPSYVRIARRLKADRLLIGHPGKREKYKRWTWEQLKEYVSLWMVDNKQDALMFIGHVQKMGGRGPFENWN